MVSFNYTWPDIEPGLNVFWSPAHVKLDVGGIVVVQVSSVS